MQEIRPFSPTDVEQIVLRPADWFAFRSVPDWHEAVRQYMAQGAVSDSLLVNGELVIIANLRLLWPGVGEVWALAGPAITRHPVSACRVSRKWLDNCIEDFHLHRVQCKVIAGYLESHTWAKWLGFIPECYMKQYGPLKEDYVQYMRLTKWAE